MKQFKVNIETGVWGYGDSSQAAYTSNCKKIVVVSGREIQVFFHEGGSRSQYCVRAQVYHTGAQYAHT